MNPTQKDASEVPSAGVVRPMNAKDGQPTEGQMKRNSMVIVGVYVVLIALGIGTGYLLSSKSSKVSSAPVMEIAGTVNTDKVVGIQDASKYTNCPIGKLEKGGLDGEGTHHLIREGGPSQTAYLTSSLIDLDEYVGRTVKVCGQTLKALHAPWLMDVERLEPQGK